MKLILSLALLVSSFAFGAFTETDLAALKPLGIYYVKAETTGDDWAKLMCPEIMALQVNSKEVLVLEVTDNQGKVRVSPISSFDREVSISYYAWNFLAKDTNGGGVKFTSWNQISDGFSMPSQDWLFRNAVFRIGNKLTTTPNVRLEQTIRITPYTMAFIRAGKDRVITSELVSQTNHGLLLRRRVDGKEIRTCAYVPARKDQRPGNGEE